MSVVLLCLMAYQVSGEALHEWFGIGMTILLIIHHILNRRWYAVLLKGKYNTYRILTTAVNTLLLLSIALTAVCGMSMSSHAVPFLYGMLPISFARRFHLAMSYWSFLLMGLHLGFHLPTMTAKMRPGKTLKLALICLCTVIAGIGLGLFLRNGIPDYIFFRVPFAFFDYDKNGVFVFLENMAELFFFVFIGADLIHLIKGSRTKKAERNTFMLPILSILLCFLIGMGMMFLNDGNGLGDHQNSGSSFETADRQDLTADADETDDPDHEIPVEIDDGFIMIPGGTFLMGSPETENWRIDDETLHEVSISSFLMDPYETTQEEYERLMGMNPSVFKGSDLPVESISWLDAIVFANAKSIDAGLTPAYAVSDTEVIWDRSADGYRLPTEAEWEYACRAGTATPFNTERSLDADSANFYGHYPYEIEENYFNDSVLEARPGVYRQKTVEVGSFYENSWGLYDMHGNVNEWCWDYYGQYDLQDTADPSGAAQGSRHVYRGGGWNDFGKNMRSAYRAAGQSDLIAANLGVRLVRNAGQGLEMTVAAAEKAHVEKTGGRVLIAFFSWSGNTRGIAYEIQDQTGADLFEITLTHPYSTDYSTVLMEAQEDQHKQARPQIQDPPESIDDYDVILLGYPNWWASIPMPIASFLELYDFSGKTIIPFCSHGGGRFGQSLTAIAKLAPESIMKEGLSIHYSGGRTLSDDVSVWLDSNGIERK